MPTKIQWCDESWNIITGCSHAGSPGCDHCYAKRMAQRLKGRYGYPKDDPFRVTFHPDRLDQPLRWKKPRRIFVVSMGDLFHKDVKGDWMWRILDTAYDSPSYHRHIYMFLTKRPERMAAEMDNWMRNHALSTLPKRWWLGVTAENQEQADKRVPILSQIPATVRFLSLEPMLGEIDLNAMLFDLPGSERFDTVTHYNAPWDEYIDWVIVGGESGPGARPMHPDWIRSIKDQCQSVGVPFFFKQWGVWAPNGGKNWIAIKGKKGGDNSLPGYRTSMCRVGKKKAGRLLDGKIYNELPKEAD